MHPCNTAAAPLEWFCRTDGKESATLQHRKELRDCFQNYVRLLEGVGVDKVFVEDGQELELSKLFTTTMSTQQLKTHRSFAVQALAKAVEGNVSVLTERRQLMEVGWHCDGVMCGGREGILAD